MTTLNVGPSRQYKTIASAVSAAKNGDTIQVDHGTYKQDYPPVIGIDLTFTANGGRVVCASSGLIPNGKGIFVVGKSTAAPTVSIDGFDFTGAVTGDNNGAGIRYQAGNLTCTNCRFLSCQDGILAPPFVRGQGSIILDRCEFASCGAGDGQSHNIYIGQVASFKLTNSYSHDSKVGHLVKTRALSSVITNCRLFDNAGTGSYSVDCPNGGDLLISNCQIEQGKSGQNPYLLTYACESKQPQNAGRNVHVTSCTIVNDATRVYLVLNAALDTPYVLTDCSFFGVPQTIAALGRGPVTLQNPTWLQTRPPLDDTSPPYTPATLEYEMSNQGDGSDDTEPMLQNPDTDAIADDEEHGSASK